MLQLQLAAKQLYSLRTNYITISILWLDSVVLKIIQYQSEDFIWDICEHIWRRVNENCLCLDFIHDDLNLFRLMCVSTSTTFA